MSFATLYKISRSLFSFTVSIVFFSAKTMKTGLQQASAFHSNLSLCKTSHSGLKGYIESKESDSERNGVNGICHRARSDKPTFKYRLRNDRAFRQKIVQTAVVGWAFFFLVSRFYCMLRCLKRKYWFLHSY